MNEIVFVCGAPRTGSNMLCDLISQVGYINLGELFNPKIEGEVFNARELPKEFFDHSKIVVKMNGCLAVHLLKKLKTRFEKITTVALYRKNVLRQFISYRFASATSVYMHRTDNSPLPDGIFPVGACANNEDKIEKNKAARSKLMEDEDFIYKTTLSVSTSVLTMVVTNIRMLKVIGDSLPNVHKLSYEEMIANPKHYVQWITGVDASNIQINTIRQSDEAAELMYQHCLAIVGDELSDWITGSWTQDECPQKTLIKLREEHQKSSLKIHAQKRA